MPKAIMYAVQSADGKKFYRSAGYSGSGEHWVEDLTKARIYASPGPAKTVITYWSGPDWTKDFGIPVLVELHVTKIVKIDQKDRVKDAEETKRRRKKKAKVAALKKKVKYHQDELHKAMEDL